MLCALVIGHKKSSPGAINKNSDLTEFDFNDNLSNIIIQSVTGVSIEKVYRETYKKLPDDINAINPDFIVSMHCNAFNEQASGTEVLYYHRSEEGKKIAEILQDQLVNQLGLKNRGTKAITSEDRGGYLLRYTNAPSVISEPFFIDNDSDLAAVQNDLDGLAQAYARSIEATAEIINSG